jgi:PAS domain S-box-containing protein
MAVVALRDFLAAEGVAAHRVWFEHSDESLFIVGVRPDGEFVIEALNPAHERRTGLRNGDLAGRALREVLPPPVAEAISANYRRCVEAGTTIRYDETLELPAGVRHWKTVLTPIRDGSGRISRILGSARDVTEERKAQELAESTRVLLQQVVEASPDILYVFDLHESRNAFAGGRFEDLLGYSLAQATAMGQEALLALVHPDDRAGVDELLMRRPRLRDGEVVTAQYRMRRPDGTYIWLKSREKVFARGPDGAVTQVFGAATSIQDQKNAEEALKASNDRLASTLSSIGDCYFTIDRDYRITGVNEACLEWMSRDRSDVIGLYYWDLCQPWNDCGAATKKAMDERRTVHGELRSAFRPDRWLDFRVYPSDQGVTVFFRDITDAMEARREVERTKGLLQRTLDALSAHVAILDGAGRIVAVNRAWHHFAKQRGYATSGHGVGTNYLEACRSAGPDEPEAAAVADGIDGLLAGSASEYGLRYLCGDRWFLLRAARFENEGAVHVVAAHEDVTELTTAKNDLDETVEQLLDLQEAERQRIGAELHDSTAQHLAAAGLGLAHVRLLDTNNPKLDAALSGVRASLDEAQREIRTFTYLLYPPNLDRDGLSLTLRDFILGFSRRTGLPAKMRIDRSIDAAAVPVRRSVLRVVQEALANVHRHAQATRISIEIRADRDRLRLRIADDGIGLPALPTGNGRPKLGVGIPGMQARVQQFGGQLSVMSDTQGTTVRATLPLVPAIRAEAPVTHHRRRPSNRPSD